jgi:hypothetical protein
MAADNICNYCKLKTLRAAAKGRGYSIWIRPSLGRLGGVNVYEVPAEDEYHTLQEGGPEHAKYFKCWFMAVTDNCVC